MADFMDMGMTVADFRQGGAEACGRESREQPPHFMLVNREWKGAGVIFSCCDISKAAK